MSVIIDTTAVPTAVRDDFARPLLMAVTAYFDQPGVEEKFQAWLKEYSKRKTAGNAQGEGRTDGA